MTDVVARARMRIEELEAELEELHLFIATADRLAGGSGLPADERPPARSHTPQRPYAQARSFPGSSPREIVTGLHAILSENRETLDRETLIERLASRSVKIPGMYPNKNLGTILWRNQRLFEHIRGRGYRWTGAPLDEDVTE